jgi:hypothetical protein
VVIENGRIVSAGCFLPLSEQTDVRRSFGTRHRAALGLAEESDAVVLVVSEESGSISLAYDANLYYDLTVEGGFGSIWWTPSNLGARPVASTQEEVTELADYARSSDAFSTTGPPRSSPLRRHCCFSSSTISPGWKSGFLQSLSSWSSMRSSSPVPPIPAGEVAPERRVGTGVSRSSRTRCGRYLDLRRFDSEGEYRAPVLVERSGAAAEGGTLEVTVEPDTVQITLEEKLIRSVEVESSATGFPAAGYELVQLSLSPSAVELEGPRSIVETSSGVRTEELDLSTRREDSRNAFGFVRPHPLVRFPGGAIVEVRGTIDESVVLETFEPVEIVVSGLSSRLSLAQSLPGGLIRVQERQIEVTV